MKKLCGLLSDFAVEFIAASADFTLREALHEPSFWWISLGHASALFVVSAMGVHLVSHLKQSQGYSLGQASGAFLPALAMPIPTVVSACPVAGSITSREPPFGSRHSPEYTFPFQTLSAAIATAVSCRVVICVDMAASSF